MQWGGDRRGLGCQLKNEGTSGVIKGVQAPEGVGVWARLAGYKAVWELVGGASSRTSDTECECGAVPLVAISVVVRNSEAGG